MEFCYKKIFYKEVLLLALILVFAQNLLHAQYDTIYSNSTLLESISTQKTGMIVLGSWATLNIISGSIGAYRREGSSKYFHQMNAAWNLVNLGIAGFGYRGASRIDTDLNYSSGLDKMQDFERLLIINAGLDLIYIGTGAWLWSRGISENSSRQIGYGKSIVLQGSFLLLFDSILYLAHSRHTQELLKLGDQLSFTGNGFLLSF
jgi:hypothetical protein